MKTEPLKIAPFPNKSAAFAAWLAEAAQHDAKTSSAILDDLDCFVERCRRNLRWLDRRFPVPGYAEAFEVALAESSRTLGVSARDLLRGWFYQHYHIFHLRTYPAYLPMVVEEKCRAAYLPETDVGPLAISNTDDPIHGYRPAPPFVPPTHAVNVFVTSVGSGLHFDEEPRGFFPVDEGVLRQVISKLARDAPQAVEMLEALSPHFGRENLLLVDREKRAARIDKCSFNRIAIKLNTAPCIEHVSGMVCRDPAYKQYQGSLRQAYLDSVGGNWSGYEGQFWLEADRKETRLAGGLEKLRAGPTYHGVLQLFQSHEKPGHLCKHGEPASADDPNPSYTLQRHAHLLERDEYQRWQWDVKRNLPTCQGPCETYRWKVFAH